MVIASIFSPGSVCALERNTGKLIWQKELAGFGGPAVYLAGDMLFAKSSHILYAMNPGSGEG
jgi:outer membrane protein assembly factor BamB